MKTEIKIDDINSCGIAIEARAAGINLITELATNGKSGDAKITIYQVGDVRVADTNGDPIWEEQDRAAFAELLDTEGIKN